MITTMIVFTCMTISLAQSPPPPPGDHGSTGNQDPRGAPIDGGLGILLALGAGYGVYKLYRARKKQKNDPNENEESKSMA